MSVMFVRVTKNPFNYPPPKKKCKNYYRMARSTSLKYHKVSNS